MTYRASIARPVTRAFAPVFLLAFALAACGVEDAAVDLSGGAAADPGGGGKADAALRRCTGRAFAAPTATGFRHTGSRLAALTGARHRAQDVIVPP